MHIPANKLHYIVSAWSFLHWGIDIVGALPLASGRRKYAIVATNYFTKWVEVEAYANITQTEVIKFIWKHIVCRFRIPLKITADNGTQFTGRTVEKFCSGNGIQLSFSSRIYPQGNGQAESSNKIIFECIKKKLEDRKGRWADELQNVLWAYRTTRKTTIGETLFLMVYEIEAIIPIKLPFPTALVESGSNEDARILDLNLIVEKREVAAIKMLAYQQNVAVLYNKQIKGRSFNVGDLVLREVTLNTKNKNDGKLGPTWEGPYKITKVYGKRAYGLET